jgi:ABC-type antimicrobial peptide transport system permease subunit
MLRNYLKIAVRNIWKHKGYSFINIAGLALGMACALFILLAVQDELSFDRFHENAASIFRVEQDQKGGQGLFHVNVTPYAMGPALKTGIPEITDSTRAARTGALLVRFGEKAFFESRITAVDPSFLRMFSFPALRGTPEGSLNDPTALVVTEDFALKYFGTVDAVGKSVTINNAFPATVKAVLKNVPANSTIVFDALLPVEFLKNFGVNINNWGTNEIITYVRLQSSTAAATVNEKITKFYRDRGQQSLGNPSDPAVRRQIEAYKGPDFTLMPLVDIRLYGFFGFNRTDRSIKTIYTFGAIALFILLIACINFMNLATARSANRAKEVGLRKTVGALRKSIAGQFYGESVFTAVLSGLIALALVVILRPGFNALLGKQISLASIWSLKFLVGIAGVTLFTGFVAGSYPALFLSAFRPATVLKGKVAGGARSALFRKMLVVVQFSLSVLLLIGMGVVSAQLDFMRSKKLGYEKDQLVYLPMRGETARSYASLKEQLLLDPKIQGVTATHQPPTSIGSNSWGASWDGKDPEQRFLIGIAFVDFDYPETMKIEMAAGRTFDKKYATDNGRAFLVNEEVPKLMGLKSAEAVGKRFNFQGIDGTIVGVMKNFHYQSVRTAIEPMAVAVVPRAFAFAVVRLQAGAIGPALEAVKTTWQKVYPQYPFDYRFFDQDFEQMFRSDERMGAMMKIFAVLAVFIACLGLFGLASFTAEQRTKEIGIRKVLGAGVPGIIVLLTREFVQWVLIADLIAWPAAYFLMRNWLQGFAYRTGIAWWLFLATGAGTLAVALLTVGFQAFRAANSNPVHALKYE